ncbi:MAG TPA: tetratricopeptide repeat protein [Burkholderiales bacterium]|nr:tetratricopeptide repeat protein [Burkholderiales bacterium]
MSLLLEALKKAERAKEEAERRAKGAAEPAEAPVDPEATVAAERHVTTKDELPDISAPLEILSDDLRPQAPPRAPASPLALEEETPAPAPEALKARREPARESARAASAEAPAGDRAAAQKVFEAKFKEPNPRMPFYITMGILGVFAVGTAIYFYIQLRPAPALVNTNPVRPTDEKPVDVAALKPPPAQNGAPSAPAATDIPGLPSTPGASAPTPQGAPTPSAPAAAPASAGGATAAPASSAPVASGAATPPARAATSAVAPSATPPAATVTRPRPAASSGARRPAAAPAARESELSVSRGGPQIHPKVLTGYAAYQAGDLTTARNEYQQALRDEPSNHDALLGLAAVETRAGRLDLADGYYRKVLQADPRDPHAQAGMIALRNQQIDPILAESRVKSLLAVDQNANVLYFTLGNQYAQQGRWPEAQQAYFKAYASDPENADFAFNLAVSFDHIRQPQLALEYYRRAVALAEKRSASFSLATARTRIQQLAR